MDKTFGEFLKQKRLEKNLTQKELARLLIVSESAVSKWEKDVAHPDITLLPKISEILGVTEHELITASIDKNSRTEKSQAKKWRAITMTWSLFFYITYGIALFTCFICNLSINGTLSWFWIVLSALLLAFTFTNLPKILKKHRLLMLPLSMYLALCLLLGVCCIYTHGDWFWIASMSVLLSLTMIFSPIFIAKYSLFNKIKKYNEFVSVALCFLILNVLLVIIDSYTIINQSASQHWYFSIALPITLVAYVIINILLCVRFVQVNKLLRTSVILWITGILAIVLPLIMKVTDQNIQKEIDDFNVFRADFAHWNVDTVDNNVFCIIAITIIGTAIAFLISGLIVHFKRKKSK